MTPRDEREKRKGERQSCNVPLYILLINFDIGPKSEELLVIGRAFAAV